MIKSSSLKEDKNTQESITENVRNLFRLEKIKETNDARIKGIRNLFILKEENKTIKYRILRDV